MIDPIELPNLSKEQLLDEYHKICIQEEELAAGKVVLKEEVLSRMKDDAEVWGTYSVSKVRRPNYTKVTLETAKLLGAVKEAVDTSVLRKIHAKGVQIEGLTETVYPLIKSLEGEPKS
jgi:hypothetical protein